MCATVVDGVVSPSRILTRQNPDDFAQISWNIRNFQNAKYDLRGQEAAEKLFINTNPSSGYEKLISGL